jgi:dihydrofolate reductase
MTLDGVVADPHKWSFPYWDDGIAEFKGDELKATEALLLGRRTYEGFAAAWPGRKGTDWFANKFNSMPKYVASRTLKNLAWENSHVLEGDLEEAVTVLKEKPGGDLSIHGSISVINQLMRTGLVDRFHIIMYPIVLGEGRRLFDEGAKANLKLAESKTFSKGAVAMVYDWVSGKGGAVVKNPVYR